MRGSAFYGYIEMFSVAYIKKDYVRQYDPQAESFGFLFYSFFGGGGDYPGIYFTIIIIFTTAEIAHFLERGDEGEKRKMY